MVKNEWKKGLEGFRDRINTDTQNLTDLIRYFEYVKTTGYTAARVPGKQEILWANQLKELIQNQIAQGTSLSQPQCKIIQKKFYRLGFKDLMPFPRLENLRVRYDVQGNFTTVTLFENGIWASVGTAKLNPNVDMFNHGTGIKTAFGRVVKSYLRDKYTSHLILTKKIKDDLQTKVNLLEKKIQMVEVLWNGLIRYRRPKGHPDVVEAEKLIEKGNTLYSIRMVP